MPQAKPKQSELVQLVTVAIVGAVLVLLILWGMGYTKATNDQEFYRVVGSEMSEEDFAEWMHIPATHSGAQA
jgi:hypothetical protein